ncbi:MAG: hypothetical protein ACQET5_11720 [Halobacteriota archaeon]|uniref:hypothetical protein n=1 Tax=Natronomonas sp. TaxID=2184060 RepID=UPI003976F68A
MAPIFGYGSLILPTSLISRFETIDPELNEIYNDETEHAVREDALKKWKECQNRIKYLPTKIRGFKRYYSYESKRGGTMLEVVHTDDPEDWINGVLIFGLSEYEQQRVAQSEAGYDLRTLRDPSVEFYVQPDHVVGSELSSPEEIDLYVSPKSQEEITAAYPRNRTYHRRIVTGILMLGEMYGEEIARRFYRDFCESTYETALHSDDTSIFNTVAKNDRLRGDTCGRLYGDL